VPPTELFCPTSVLSLFCGRAGPDAVVPAMKRQLPPEGMATERMRPHFDLTRATYRLLDSRILEVAAKSLDQDLAHPLVEWLGTFSNLREAAVRTVACPEDEVLVTLKEPTPFTSTQGSDVVLAVGDRKVATFTFRLDLTVELGRTTVAVRQGAIDELVVALLRASALFTLEAWPKPLWKPAPISLPDVHLDVRPAFVVPLVTLPSPRGPAEQETPRPLGERPPVPGSRRTARP
jgi:hypothetical protein